MADGCWCPSNQGVLYGKLSQTVTVRSAVWWTKTLHFKYRFLATLISFDLNYEILFAERTVYICVDTECIPRWMNGWIPKVYVWAESRTCWQVNCVLKSSLLPKRHFRDKVLCVPRCLQTKGHNITPSSLRFLFCSARDTNHLHGSKKRKACWCPAGPRIRQTKRGHLVRFVLKAPRLCCGGTCSWTIREFSGVSILNMFQRFL